MKFRTWNVRSPCTVYPIEKARWRYKTSDGTRWQSASRRLHIFLWNAVQSLSLTPGNHISSLDGKIY